MNGDAHTPGWRHRVLVQHVGSHIRKLPYLVIGHGGNRPCAGHDRRIGTEDAGHIRPVFVGIRPGGACQQRSGDIRAAARQRVDAAVRAAAVEAGHDGTLHVAEPAR